MEHLVLEGWWDWNIHTIAGLTVLANHEGFRHA
jgi:hypothetical protein